MPRRSHPVSEELPAIPEIEVRDVAVERYTEYLVASNERAVPDVRDGLKPVHRRVLLALHDAGATSTSRHYKSAKIVGDTLGRYHPHGDVAVYDAATKMAQDFALRYPLIDGQGNFGSIDGDGAAAYRYTEMRLSKIGDEMLRDLETRAAQIVPWGGNYTNELDEPYVLPARFPQLFANGILTGIGTGYSSMWLPHNLKEVIDALVAILDRPDLPPDALLRYLKGPDFPTGGVVVGLDGFRSAVTTGRGTITVRATMATETIGRDPAIIITAIPWQQEKATIIAEIVLAANPKGCGSAGCRVPPMTDIVEVVDESGNDWRTEMRIVVRLRREARPERVVAGLLRHRHTKLQTTFTYNQMAYVDGYPALLNMKEAMAAYLDHQLSVLTRRTTWRRARALDALEVAEAYNLAAVHANALVPLARRSANRTELERKIPTVIPSATPRQCEVIAGMALYRFSKIDTETTKRRIAELRAEIAEYDRLLASKAAMVDLLKRELKEIRSRYGDDRRTQIVLDDAETVVSFDELLGDAPCVLAGVASGAIARWDPAVVGRRRAKDVATPEPVVDLAAVALRDRVLVITDGGFGYAVRVSEIEATKPSDRPTSLRRLVKIDDGARIAAIVRLPSDGGGELALATAKGKILRTRLTEAVPTTAAGLKLISVAPGDRVVGAAIVATTDHVVLVASSGYATRYPVDKVPIQGRGSQGVTAMAIDPGVSVAAMVVVEPTDRRDLLLVCADGRGKRLSLSAIAPKGRGTKGVIAIDRRKGPPVVAAAIAADDETLWIATTDARLVPIPVATLRRQRTTTAGSVFVESAVVSASVLSGTGT
jgi:DNA gyrase subunit A